MGCIVKGELSKDCIQKHPSLTQTKLKKEPQLSRWRRESFPLYDEVAYLVDGVIATGEAAFRAGQVNNTGNNDQDKTDDTDSNRDSNSLEDSSQSSNQSGSSGKRPSSPSQEPSSKRQRVSKSASARALSEMTDVIRSMVDLIREPDPVSNPALQLSSPARQRAIVREAIKQLEKDEDLSDNEQVLAIELFTMRPAIADSFTAISRKSLRTQFIQRQLQTFQYHNDM